MRERERGGGGQPSITRFSARVSRQARSPGHHCPSLPPSLPLSLPVSLVASPALPLSLPWRWLRWMVRDSGNLVHACMRLSNQMTRHLAALRESQSLPPLTRAWLSLTTLILTALGRNHTVSALCEGIAVLCSNKHSDAQLSRCWASVQVIQKPSWHGQSCQVQITTFTDKLRVT